MAGVGNITYPVPVFTAAGSAERKIGSTTLPLTASGMPASGGILQAQKDAHGMAPVNGIITIEVDGPSTIQINVWSKATNAWIVPGSTSTQYQKTFAGAGFDFFVLAPGSLFYISQGATTVNGYTDAPLFPIPTPGISR